MLNGTVADRPQDTVSAILEGIFTRDSTSPAVAIAHGYGIQVKIQDGQLVIRDGIGRHRRERKYPKADRTLQRIVITGPDGYVTLEALQWCAQHGIAVATFTPDCELVSHYATTDRVTEPKLLRKQAAADTSTALEVARELLTRKVSGQADNLLKLFNDANSAARLYNYAARMAESESISQRDHDTASLSELEGWAGRDYFASWSGKAIVTFDKKSASHIPANWTAYAGRSTQLVKGGKKYNASDPVNAMLNYAYALGFAECRAACIAYGLSPALGSIHTDRTGRDSLALDVLEALRPEIDAYVLGLCGIGAEPRIFSYRDFTEPYGYPAGTVRMVAPLTHEIAEASYSWQSLANETVSVIAGIITGRAGKRGTHTSRIAERKESFTSAHVTPDDILSSGDYARLFGSIVPPFIRQRRGHPPIPDRTIIAAIIHCERNHRPWAHVPDSFGISYRTMTDRRRMWQRSGDWPAIQAAIRDLAILPA